MRPKASAKRVFGVFFFLGTPSPFFAFAIILSIGSGDSQYLGIALFSPLAFPIGGVPVLIAATVFYNCQARLHPIVNASIAGLVGSLPLLLFALPLLFDDRPSTPKLGWNNITFWPSLCVFASLFSAFCLWLINRRWPPRDASGAPATRP